MMSDHIVILGSGIQGICCALALANTGKRITILDKTVQPYNRASLRSEAKIHLGFVYAKDESFRTSSLMLKAGLHFGPLIESFIGEKVNWKDFRSRKFNYIILKNSFLSAQQLFQHYQALQQEYEQMKDKSLHYLGEKPFQLWDEAAVKVNQLENENVIKCIPTEEASINPINFREFLLTALSKKLNISFKGNHLIQEIKKTSYGYAVAGTNGNGAKWKIDSTILINCLWENRIYFDQQLGIPIYENWVYRLKHGILGISPSHLRDLNSFTFVLGAFGDIVNYDNYLTYISWYPKCMTRWSSEICPPTSWEKACNGQIKIKENRKWINEALAEVDNYFPGYKNFQVKRIDSGIIFSRGKSDISDPQSELHERFDIGIIKKDGYYSVSTGKFTSAPLFAKELVEVL